ncbi:unnamed protein product [Microthlaspi erraticum]|uniref:Uncharacterized protein n=1 Tax=Microthlaspi erraticum TaxID=1685480 RepID=A0A6D2IPY5_9BRAS|nr:unnamed protein product [Microthlaspi erraticum]
MNWSQQDFDFVTNSGWAFPTMMGMISAQIDGRHSSDECIHRYAQVHGIQLPEVAVEVFPQPIPKRSLMQKIQEALGENARSFKEILGEFIKQKINSDEFLKSLEQYGLRDLASEISNSLAEKHPRRKMEFDIYVYIFIEFDSYLW